jgi:hypothetical protein
VGSDYEGFDGICKEHEGHDHQCLMQMNDRRFLDVVHRLMMASFFIDLHQCPSVAAVAGMMIVVDSS